MQKSLEEKHRLLRDAFSEQPSFATDDVLALYPEANRNTINWTLSKLAAEGKIRRIRTGVYSFLLNEPAGNGIVLSTDAERIDEILAEEGFEYYISGADILSKYMHHVPEHYPVILFVEKAARDGVSDILRRNGIAVTDASDFERQYQNLAYFKSGVIAVLYLTDNFDYALKGLATKEKAFVDLFYAISRNGYPISLNELARMYQNMARQGAIDKKKMIAAASRRSLQHDIRLIAENSLITDAAFELAQILRKSV